MVSPERNAAAMSVITLQKTVAKIMKLWVRSKSHDDREILEPIVSTASGEVRGQLREDIHGDTYYSIDDIPYAKPPLGKLSFKSPQTVESLLGVRDCTICPPKCMQSNRDNGAIEGKEDCLYLHVFTKKLRSAKPLPVLAYLIGGGFATGAASRNSCGPDYFKMKDVILTTIGYRLGALGFLSFPQPELQVPGNAGLKDIVMALQWREKNCQYFNGDPDNITPERIRDLKIWTREELKQCPLFVFSLMLENESAPDAILTNNPLDMFANKQSWCHKIPLVLGGNSFESLMHYNYDVEQSFDVLRLSSYDFMYHPMYRHLKTRIPNAKAPTYLYCFDFDSPYFNLYCIKHCGREVRGVCHEDELSYVFFVPDSFKLQRNSKEFKMIECMIDWITAFALNSDPNCEKLSSLVWEPLTADARYSLNISDKINFVKWPEEEKCIVWNQYYEEAGIRTF